MFITEWGNPYVAMTDEAVILRNKYKQSKDEEERNTIKQALFNITDTRLFCIIVNCQNNSIRHIVRVTDDAESRLSEFKNEYYSVYESYSTDRFFFFKGFHRVKRFTDTLALTNFSIEEFETALKTIETVV